MNKRNIFFTIPLNTGLCDTPAVLVQVLWKSETKQKIFLLSCFAKCLRQQNCQVICSLNYACLHWLCAAQRLVTGRPPCLYLASGSTVLLCSTGLLVYSTFTTVLVMSQKASVNLCRWLNFLQVSAIVPNVQSIARNQRKRKQQSTKAFSIFPNCSSYKWTNGQSNLT